MWEKWLSCSFGDFCRLFIPVEEDQVQHIYIVDKKEDGTVTKTKDVGVRYVPLTDAPGQ